MRPAGWPGCTPGLLRDLAAVQAWLPRRGEDHGDQPRISAFVLGSSRPGVFNLGVDFALLAGCVRRGDRESLVAYAQACIDMLHASYASHDLPLGTVALVQGDALGVGFETALCCGTIVAERRAKFGYPEVQLSLFPGMAAFSLLSRRLDAARAERLIFSNRIYGAEELHQMGLVDLLAEDGHGEAAVRDYLSNEARRPATRHILGIRRRVQPLSLPELRDVILLWADAVFRLEEDDLRAMEQLAAAPGGVSSPERRSGRRG
jgi:DSF synthase